MTSSRSIRSFAAFAVALSLSTNSLASVAPAASGTLNPLVVEVLREEGIDISGKQTRAVFDVFKSGQMFAYVITVCDEASAERCPIFPGVATRLHWSFPDPSRFEGTWEEKLEQTRQVRDVIEAKLQEFCSSSCVAKAA